MSIYDKAIRVGRSPEHEILCPDCAQGIGKAGVVFRADQRVYRHGADLHIQVFGSPDFQHGVQGVEQIRRIVAGQIVERDEAVFFVFVFLSYFRNNMFLSRGFDR